MRKLTRISQLVLLVVVLAGLLGCQPGTPDIVKVGAIFDLTGATSDVSVPYANGVRDYVEYINAQGGINGRKIQLIDHDYGYNIERAKALYDKLIKEDKVIAIMGWGTGDTEALRERIAADKVPFMSASYAEELTIAAKSPYNFLIGVTYSDQMRIALQYIRNNWQDASRPPRVAFIYNDTAFGKSPIEDGRAYAAAHDIQIVADTVIPLAVIDATSELKKMAEARPDYAIVQQTTGPASIIVLNAHQLGLPTKFVVLNWAADEKFISLCGQAAEGVLGTVPFPFISENAPGLKEISKFNEARGVKAASRNIRYVQGWVTMQVMAEGIRLAGNNLTGEKIRQALETMTGLNLGGITPPITFSATSHKGVAALRIYQVQNGQWVPVTDYIKAQP
jgi:branched-chain amino acid transport system substrate-binding protein